MRAAEFQPREFAASGSVGDESLGELLGEEEEPAFEEQVGMLERIFPELDPLQLKNCFAMHDYNLLTTVEELLQQYSSAEDSFQQMNDVLEPSIQDSEEKVDPVNTSENTFKPVCKYFLQGQCLIRNCEFLHSETDRSAICKFFLQGFCMRGDQCAYVHDLGKICSSKPATTLIENKPRVQIARNDFIRPLGVVKVAKDKNLDLASKLKLNSLLQEFDHIPPSIIKDIFYAHDRNSINTRAELIKRYGEPDFKKPEPYNANPKHNLLPSQNSVSHSKRLSYEEEADYLPWIETGEKVSDLYMESRKVAEEYSRKRNECFMKATEAFMKGDGKLAKSLSSRGREFERLASEHHKKASERIFMERNRKLLNMVQNQNVMDVHGLHPDEALEKIILAYRNLINSKSSKHLDVITGTGHHSYGTVAKIAPVLADYCSENDIKFTEMRVGNRGGVYRLYFST